MPIKENFVGMTRNGLKVIEEFRYNNKPKLRIECFCGNVFEGQKTSWKQGKLKGCGCTFPSHGETNTRLFRLWTTMKGRCYQKSFDSYKYYGGKGVIVCDEWLKDYVNFRDWCNDNGYKQGLSLDRIDSNGNYEPSNCRFVTMKEQGRNKSNNVFIEFEGRRETISAWAEITGIKEVTIRARKRKGLSDADCLKPVGYFRNSNL